MELRTEVLENDEMEISDRTKLASRQIAPEDGDSRAVVVKNDKKGLSNRNKPASRQIFPENGDSRADALKNGEMEMSNREKPASRQIFSNNDNLKSPKDNGTCMNRNFIVFRCKKFPYCGGYADRQKGIISIFLLAMLLNRTFVIMHQDPCELSEFLIPNLYDWTQCTEYILSLPEKDKSNIMAVDGIKFRNSIKNMNLSDVFRDRVVFIHTNVIMIHQICSRPSAPYTLSWAVGKSIAEISGIVLNLLFRPSALLENKVRNFMKEVPSSRRLICSHIRMGKNPTIPFDDRRAWTANVTVIFKFLGRFENSVKSTIYVASDSEIVKRYAKGNFSSVLTVNDPVIHIDRYTEKQRKFSCAGMQTVVLEQYILSMCDVLLLTRSGFGTMAAYISTKPQIIFILLQKHTIIKVTRDEIQTYFKF